MIHSHAVVMHAIIGWTSVIGSWARVEGIEENEGARIESKMNRCKQKGQLGFVSHAAYNAEMASSILNELDFSHDSLDSDMYHNISDKPPCHEQNRVLSDGICSVGAGVYIEPEVHIRNCVVLSKHKVSDSAFH